MTKTSAQLDAEIAETLRAKKWQEQIEREDQERRARIATPGPSPTQLYDERASDFAAGVFHGEPCGRAKDFRKTSSAAEALRASEAAKHLSDDAAIVDEHRTAAAAHRRAARLHKVSLAGADAAWLHDLAAINHRQAAKARASRELKQVPTPRSLAAYQAKLAAAREHGHMA